MRRSPFSLAREERLRGRANLGRVFSDAAKVELKGLKILYLQNDQPQRNRIALCPVRGFPNAVERNRQRRLARESYRLLKPRLKSGYDLAVVLYPGAYGLAERCSQMETLLTRAGLIDRP
jgi:ribonuclease P protein component